jgi:hypothetical protein
MHESCVVFGLGYVALGALSIGLAVPLIRRRIRPNAWYGIRIPAAFSSEEAWYRINRHGGKSLAYMGLAVAAVGAGNLLFLPEHPSPGVAVVEAFLPGILLVPTLIHVYRYPRAPEKR